MPLPRVSLPKHKNPTHEAALAPYNFVPLPDVIFTINPEELPDHDGFYPERYSGHVDCRLTTESPLYVRCPLTPSEFVASENEAEQSKKPWREQVRNRPDFYYTEPGKPRIPGSSLRGMLRSLVEIVSFSKLSAVSDRRLVYRAVGDTTNHGEQYRTRIMHFDGEGTNRSGKRCHLYTPLVRAGYMERSANGDWAIRPAVTFGGVSFARIRRDLIPQGLARLPGLSNAYQIFVRPGAYDYYEVRGGFLRVRQSRILGASGRRDPSLQEASLVLSGEMFSKRSEAVVFARNPQADLIPVSDELELSYREQVSAEQEQLLGSSDGVLQVGQPVFYLMEDNKLVFFGHTMMMRLPYPKNPAQFAPDRVESQLQKLPTNGPPNVDFAESLFGYTKPTGTRKGRAYASRVFVSDAVLEPAEQDPWLTNGVITPHILAGPKPTTFQHYLVQQQPDAVEVGRTRDGTPRTQKQLSDYAAKPSQTVLRGHKLYWHKGPVTAESISAALDELRDKQTGEENEHDTQHTQMKPVRAGVTFAFRIHFENLSQAELGALMWALDLPDPQGREHRHSLGMGKPYGLGAVRLEAQVTRAQDGGRYQQLFGAQRGWHMPSSLLSVEEVTGCIQAFGKAVHNAIGAKDSETLSDQERIRMLLKMLEWPGPDRRQTRYLEIEREDRSARRGKVNEYKDRPVLPDPLHVEALFGVRVPMESEAQLASSSPASPPPESKPKSVFSSDELAAKRPQPVAEKSATVVDDTVQYPAQLSDLKPGMLIEGVVVRAESSRIVLRILDTEASLALDNILPPVRDEWDRDDRFPVGKLVRVYVKGVNKSGRLQVTMRRER